MRRANLIDQKIESLLRGTAPDASDHLATELAFMRENLSEAFPLPVISERIEDAHLARMMAAVVPAPALAVSDVVPDRTRPLETLKASFSRKVAAATLAFSTAFGGAAYAGVLPDPLQRAVAKAASVVGLNLPGAEDDALAEDDSRGGLDTELGDDGHGISPALEDPDDERARSDAAEDEAEDRRDDERDARRDSEDDAADRTGDETDQREDEADDGRDAQEDAEDDAADEVEDRREDAEDREDEEIDQREEDADDERDAQEDAEDDAADEAEESREELEELEEETRNDTDEPGEDGSRAEESEVGDDESDA